MNPGEFPNTVPVGSRTTRPVIVRNLNQPVSMVLAQLDAATPDSANLSNDPVIAQSLVDDTYSSVSKILGMFLEPIAVADLTAHLPQIMLGSHYYSEVIMEWSVGQTAPNATLYVQLTPITEPFGPDDMTWNGVDLLDQADPTEIIFGAGGSIGAAAVHTLGNLYIGVDDPDIWFPIGFRLDEKGYNMYGIIIECKPKNVVQLNPPISASATMKINRNIATNLAWVPQNA